MASVPCYSVAPSPMGELLLTSNGEALTGVYPSSHRAPPELSTFVRDDRFFTGVRDQLAAYFAGSLQAFDVPLSPAGTAFQRAVWAALNTIPFGLTWSYGRLANFLGKPKASRAVGLANGKNPLSIIVPCHRVIGADGSLTGYAGGVEMKRWLLEHEASVLGAPHPIMGATRPLPAVTAPPRELNDVR